jgi:uncharacterized RDD family membrane protein YckC
MDKDYFADAYSPPGSDVNAGLTSTPRGVELAERATRFLAVMIDGALACIPFLPMLGVGLYFLSAMQFRPPVPGGESSGSRIPGVGDGELLVLLGGGMAIGFLGLLGLAIYQWVLITRTGQSLGKKWTGVRIELIDGGPVNFTSGVLLRNWVPKFMSAVPYLGAIFSIVDALFIFREDRRCIHDLIAGTRVVRHQR